MGKFTVNNLKSLANTISGVVDQVEQKDVSTAFANSLTEKALQLNEEKDEKEESPAEEKAEDKAEMLMKRLAAKALKRAKKKAATNEQTEKAKASSIKQPIKRNPLAKPKIKTPHDAPKPSGHYVKEEETHLAEKAAPGYEDWASDPKVKRSFKEQYGKDWKQVMYGRSWNMKKMDEEIQLEEGVKRMRRLRSAHLSGKGSRETADAYDKELSKVSANRLRRGGATKQTVRGFFNDKPITPAANRAYTEFAKRAMAKASAKGKKVFESEQLDELSNQLLHRAKYASWVKRKLSKKTGEALDKKINRELLRRGDVHADRPRERRRSRSSEDWMSEDVQLNEAGYKRLGRIKGAAYKAELASRGADPNTSMNALMKTSKLKRAAAEREAQVAAGMARRGGASPDAVRGGGSRIGKSGKYTQKAGALANQRDKALQSFRSKVRTAELFGRETDKGAKRERQQAQAKFNMNARHGDFGYEIAPEIKKAVMRARSNYEKKYGRLKGK
jgi:hypothetical protein